MPKFFQNDEITYIPCAIVKENPFIGKQPHSVELPRYEDVRSRLPIPMWAGHETTIDCYHKAWEIAFSRMHNPTPGTKFVSPFIDAAFNDCIFMWDSVFMLMFGKYAHHIFNFQQTLDNFYAHQHQDGFISREILEWDSSEKFTRHDPSSTGPNVMPWCEWEYYLLTGDKARIRDVFPALLGYHRWLRMNRTWPGGGYYSSGWGCGMDNQPRMPGYTIDDVEPCFHHGHMVWVDACIQQIISCNVLIEMARICDREADVADMVRERERLTRLVNETLWDKETHFYYDLWQDGQLSNVKSIAAYWALLADVIPADRLAPFVAHLDNEREFKRPNRVPTLSADHPGYREGGQYWCGSIWAPTNHMVLCGLRRNGCEAMAHDIAVTALESVVKVFEDTGTLWENYAPEMAQRGSVSAPNFVGWSGIFPIADLFEYVFGIEARAEQREIVWHIRLTEEFGVRQLPFGLHGMVDLHCAPRQNASEKPRITVRSDEDLTLTVRWGDQAETIFVKGTKA